MPWGVAVGFSVAPLVMGLFMVILKDPEAARNLGLLGAKAQLTAGTADWPTFWSLLGQAVTVGGSILFAFLTAWVFGREFADRTVGGLLATATPRRTIVIAKALVIATWGAGDLSVGPAARPRDRRAGRPPGTGPVRRRSRRSGRSRFAALLTIALQGMTAFFAGVGHGYIAPLAWAVAMVAVSQVVAVLGWGAWFPWAVPAIVAGAEARGRARRSGRDRDGRPGRRRWRDRDGQRGGSAPTRLAEPARSRSHPATIDLP